MNKKSKQKTFYNFLFFIIFIAIIFFATFFIFRNNIINFITQKFGNIISNSSILEIKNSELEIENKNLKDLLSNATNSNYSVNSFSENGLVDTIAANATFFDKFSFVYSDILLNKGSDDGVSDSKMVFISGAFPVGVIKNTLENSSKLELWTSYKKITEGIIFNNKNNLDTNPSSVSSSQNTIVDSVNSSFAIELIGDGSFGFYSRVLDSYNIKEGDIVYLKNYPSLAIAKVVKIEDLPNENEKIIYLKSNFDNSKARLFFIER